MIQNIYLQLDAIEHKGPGIYRIEELCEGIEPLEWLQQQTGSSKFYWRDRGDEFEMASLGYVDRYSLPEGADYEEMFSYLQNRLNPEYKNLRYYGGISFQKSSGDDESWDGFDNCCFVLPEIEIFHGSDGSFLAYNLFWKEEQSFDEVKMALKDKLKKLVWGEEPLKFHTYKCLSHTDLPSQGEWFSQVNYILKQIEKGDVNKVVLARRSSLECKEKIDTIDLMRQVKTSTEDCYHFCFMFEDGKSFLGASPERLYERKGHYIRSEALAGTRPRGATEDEDQLLSIDLLSSKKDIQEHRFVVDQIYKDLESLCQSLRVNREVSLIKLERGQHLFSGVKGILNDDVDDATLLNVLHPTPAIGGSPRDKALDIINKLEQFTRAWYSGPVGWISYDSVEFAVAIRSALINSNTLHLFSGAGIVKGSSPEDEWNEIENKIANFKDLVK
jgi:menaquinone-specific isochorismate synthase